MKTAERSRFDYEVRIKVRLSLEEAKLLKKASEDHYDLNVQAAGNHGVINGLKNIAEWHTDEPNRETYLPCSSDDLDLLRKCLEQAPITKMGRRLNEDLMAAMRQIETETNRCRRPDY